MKVPGEVIPLRAPEAPKIDPTYLLMAAGTMYEMGRLFHPEPEPLPPKDK